jgi:hypothetical protein
MKPGTPWGESLLRSFCVTDELEQEALGDLLEDWTVHTREAGVWRANIWYLRQAVSLIPHLLRSWLRQVDRLVAVKTVCLVAALFVLVGYLTILKHSAVLTVVYFGLSMLGVSTDALTTNPILLGPDTDPVFVHWAGLAIWVSAISTLYTFGAGIVAGALCGRASMIAVVWLSLLWAIASPIYVLASMPDLWPSWYLATYPASMVSGTIAGGCVGVLLRARLASRRARHVT